MVVRLFAFTCFFFVCAGVLPASGSHAGFRFQKEFTDPDPDGRDFFGSSVAISDDYLLVGAESFGNGNIGQAFVYDARTGELIHTLNDPDFFTNDFFGRGVAISGNHLLVGAASPFDDQGGRAYLFDALSGQLRHTFQAPGTADNFFPSSMAISGNYVLIGSQAGQTLTGPPFPAQVFLFDAVSGNLVHTFVGPELASHNGFGDLVDISGNTILIAAPQDDNEQILIYDASTRELLDSFGDPALKGLNSIATDGNRILIGHNRAGFGVAGGEAFLFDTAGNNLQSFSDPASTFNFLGTEVAFSGQNVLLASSAGSVGDTPVEVQALLFDSSSGTLIQRFGDPSPAATLYSIAMASNHAGDKIVLGAFNPIDLQSVSGRVLLFTTVPEPASIVLGGILICGSFGRQLQRQVLNFRELPVCR
jgi:outer membrane protein assembly factor BamB